MASHMHSAPMLRHPLASSAKRVQKNTTREGSSIKESPDR